MPWGDQGVTNVRKLLDQSAVVNLWGANQARVQLNKLQTSGYIRRLKLWLPPTTFTGTIGTGAIAPQGSAQLPPFRSLANFFFKMQGIAALYDVTGYSLYWLQYVGNGRKKRTTAFNNRYNMTNPTQGAYNGGAAVANYNNAIAVAGNNPTLTLAFDLPLTEEITFKDVSIPQANNSVAVVAEKTVEVGLITNQNVTSNINIGVLLNPLYSTATDAPVQVTGNAVASGPATFYLSAEAYDVPDNIADRPLALAQSFVITRSEQRVAFNGGAATIRFDSAGKLMTVGILCFDVNNNLVDVSTTPLALLQFLWGNTVHKIDQYVFEMLKDLSDTRDLPVPQGMLGFDFYEDGSYTDFIDTDDLTNIRCLVSGLTGVDHVIVVEERLIGVKVG